MGCIKSNNYTKEENDSYLLHRALAHPARIKMVNILKKKSYRNTDLSIELNLAASTVKEHVDKLKDADLVRIEYFIHHYFISIDKKRLDQIKRMAD